MPIESLQYGISAIMAILDIEDMNATEYKTYHESLLQNNHGSSPWHVFFCIFFTVQCTIYSAIVIKNVSCQYIFEYVAIVLPLILVHTVLSKYMYHLNLIIFALILWELKTHIYLTYILKTRKAKATGRRIQTITVMRGLTYLITVLAILAVDFKDFPRELAKTERYGYSLMDTGVGLFVLMSGIVHKDLHQHNLLEVYKSNFKFVTILSLLGMARYIAVKQLGYQEHVTEYGIHWNFFYTLAVCKFLSTFLLYFSSTNTLMLSTLLLMSHEFILLCGVQDWVFSDVPRVSILSANREGISSSLGYVSMYLFASNLKDELMNKHARLNFQLSNGTKVDVVQLKLIAGSVVLWALTFILNYFRPASRTLANSAYCVFIEAILVTVITVLYFFEKFFQNEKGSFQTPKIIKDINSNGLVYFLVANLLTGAINLSLRTLLCDSLFTFSLLNAYMIIALGIVIYLNDEGFSI